MMQHEVCKNYSVFVTEGDFAALLNPSFNWEQIRTDLLSFIDADSVVPLQHSNFWEEDHLKDTQARSLIWKLQVWHN